VDKISVVITLCTGAHAKADCRRHKKLGHPLKETAMSLQATARSVQE